MAAASARELVTALIDAFRESGVRAALASRLQGNPRRMVLDTPGGPEEVWIHVWTLTHGGRVSLPDELRIQMTGVQSPLLSNPEGPTLLLGYHPETESFAGFDLSRHTDFTTGSPSVQVGMACLFEARQNGLAFTRKSNQEIAVGVRPDQLLNYMLNAGDLHRHGRRSAVLQMMQRAAALEDLTMTALMRSLPLREGLSLAWHALRGRPTSDSRSLPHTTTAARSPESSSSSWRPRISCRSMHPAQWTRYAMA